MNPNTTDANIYEKIIHLPDSSLKLQQDFRLLLVGQTGSGKSRFIIQLLNEKQKILLNEVWKNNHS